MPKTIIPQPKKLYSPPTLTIHGTVQELTRSVGVRERRDGGHFPNVKTHI